MEPRKPTSLIPRSSRLPQAFMDVLAETLKERWPVELEPFQLIIEGRVYPEEIFMRVGLLEPGQLRQFNFEASVDFDGKKETALELLHIQAEAIEGAMATYFENRETDFPLAWQDYEWSGKTVFLQTSRINSALETLANDLLAQAGLSPTGEGDDGMPEDILRAIQDKLEQRPLN